MSALVSRNTRYVATGQPTLLTEIQLITISCDVTCLNFKFLSKTIHFFGENNTVSIR